MNKFGTKYANRSTAAFEGRHARDQSTDSQNLSRMEQMPLSHGGGIEDEARQAQTSSISKQMYNEHTLGHVNCPVCLGATKLYTCTLSPSMSFSEAAESFLTSREAPDVPTQARYVGKGTHKDYNKKLNRLKIFFGQIPLDQIELGHFVEYQKARSMGHGFTRKLGKEIVQSPAGPEKINAELRLLLRVMKESFGAVPKKTPWEEANQPPDLRMTAFAHHLAQIETRYLPFQVIDADIPRALSWEQQEHFLQVAASNPEWYPVWWYSLIARHTTFSSDEMRTILQGDINLSYGILGVNRRYGKNKYRRREIPLTDGACLWALERLLERAKKLTGKLSPHHYLFPGREVRNVFNPETHMSETGLRKPFEAVRDRAGLEWFQLNGWRHTAATNFAMSGMPIAILMARLGHTSPKMTAHYTHISEQAQRMALIEASQRKPVASAPPSQMPRYASSF